MVRFRFGAMSGHPKLGQVLVEGIREHACTYLLVQVFGGINIKEFEDLFIVICKIIFKGKRT